MISELKKQTKQSHKVLISDSGRKQVNGNSNQPIKKNIMDFFGIAKKEKSLEKEIKVDLKTGTDLLKDSTNAVSQNNQVLWVRLQIRMG